MIEQTNLFYSSLNLRGIVWLMLFLMFCENLLPFITNKYKPLKCEKQGDLLVLTEYKLFSLWNKHIGEQVQIKFRYNGKKWVNCDTSGLLMFPVIYEIIFSFFVLNSNVLENSSDLVVYIMYVVIALLLGCTLGLVSKCLTNLKYNNIIQKQNN